MNHALNVECMYPLSPLQEGMLFHSLQTPGHGLYVVQFVYDFEGELQVEHFRRAWETAMHRHGVLRTAFVWEARRNMQVVFRNAPLQIQFLDWSTFAPEQRTTALSAYLEQDRQQGFELSTAPLIRLTVVKLSDTAHQFVCSHHHLLLDGWSCILLLKEVRSIYNDYRCGIEPQLPVPMPYIDYIAWLNRQDMRRAESFWRELLAGVEVPTLLPLGASRVEPQRKGTAETTLILSEEQAGLLRRFARRWQVTVNTIVQGIWGLVLGRHCGLEDVVFGATVSGRPPSLTGVETMIGMFINTLPVRVRLRPERGSPEWLQGLQQEQVRAREFEYTPLFEIRKWASVDDGSLLFDSLVVFENYPLEAFEENYARGLKPAASDFRIVGSRSVERVNYPLALIAGGNRELLLRLAFDLSRWSEADAQKLLRQVMRALEQVAEDTGRVVGEIDLLEEGERRQLVEEWNRTEFEVSSWDVVKRFEEEVKERESAIAVVSEGAHLSYGELNGRSNQLAHYLRDRGVRPEVHVGVCVDRGPEMLIAILGALKAGGAYVPLDPTYPGERLAYMQEDSGIALLITGADDAQRDWAKGIDAILLPREWPAIGLHPTTNPGHRRPPESAAYLIYTSGSTGKPKGIVATHRNLRHSTGTRIKFYGASLECTMLLASIAFDTAVASVFGGLCCGGKLVVLKEGQQRDGEYIARAIEQHQVTQFLGLPSWYMAIAEMAGKGQLESLRAAIVAGEACRPEVLVRHRQSVGGARFVNEFGPAEGSVWATAYESHGLEEGDVPVGRPIANVRVYVMDEAMRLAPVGVAGECWIGGPHVTRGYWDRAALTAQRYRPDPFSRAGGERLYRTGDLVRWRSDGQLEYLGRVDQQVKIHGYRVDPGEVESAIAGLNGVTECAVMLRSQQLVAYVTGTNVPPAEELHAQLCARLPKYLVPTAWVRMPQLPRLPNGKLDRQSLPEPVRPSDEPVSQPRNPVEAVIAEIWAAVLNRGQISIFDNFFSAGGHSILAMRVVSRIRSAFEIDLPLETIFRAPTIAELAVQVLEKQAETLDSVEAEEILSEIDRLSEDEVRAHSAD